jgi:glycosyltransferase involved in cell wall biosynthesis
MNLLISTELYSPSTGGQELRYTEMAEALVARGHDVTVLCIRHAEDLPPSEVRNGVKVFRHPLSSNYQKPLIRAMRRRLWTLLRFSVWSRSMMRRLEHDLIIFNQWPLAHVVLASSADRQAGVLDWCEVRHSRLFSYIQRLLPGLTYRNIAVSCAVQAHIASVSGRPIGYVPSGVHCSRYRSRPRDERRDIIYLGRIAEHKNLPFLIRAFECLKQRGYPGGLKIAGSGPSMDAVRSRVAQSPNASCIGLLGRISDEDKVGLLSSSEVLAIPSKREGFPRVVAEAMASGLPTVTVEHPGNGTVSVLRQYECGEVCRDQPEDMAVTIENVLVNWSTYSRCALVRSEELDWGNVLPGIEALAAEARAPRPAYVPTS